VKSGTPQTQNFSTGATWNNGADQSDVISAIPGVTCEALSQAQITGDSGFGGVFSAVGTLADVAAVDFVEFRATYTPNANSSDGSNLMLMGVGA